MQTEKDDRVRQAVRKTYGAIARDESAGCGRDVSPCCGDVSPSCSDVSRCCAPGQQMSAEDTAIRLGYSADDVVNAPSGSNMGLGCGDPQAIASLQSGETVLDLGSGGGFDCFLAARAVGESGQVIGVDMTPEMVTRSRENAVKAGLDNVEFRLGEIEDIPVADSSVDVIISNCVINLSPDKQRVYGEAYRVLKPGGRIAVSDVVATAELPPDIRDDLALHAGCVAGAATVEALERMLTEAGFQNIRVQPKEESREFIRQWMPGRGLEEYIASATMEAKKPV